jgi:hypothetical protein
MLFFNNIHKKIIQLIKLSEKLNYDHEVFMIMKYLRCQWEREIFIIKWGDDIATDYEDIWVYLREN